MGSYTPEEVSDIVFQKPERVSAATEVKEVDRSCWAKGAGALKSLFSSSVDKILLREEGSLTQAMKEMRALGFTEDSIGFFVAPLRDAVMSQESSQNAFCQVALRMEEKAALSVITRFSDDYHLGIKTLCRLDDEGVKCQRELFEKSLYDWYLQGAKLALEKYPDVFETQKPRVGGADFTL